MGKRQVVVCDTNILIEFYKENVKILDCLNSIKQENIIISVITVGELLYGALNKRELKQIKKDIDHLSTRGVTVNIMDCFIGLMERYTLSHGLSVPDGIIAATSLVEDVPLFTLNQKDFKFINGLELYPID